jgi:hypothetical protein
MQAPETAPYALGEPFIGTPSGGTPSPRHGYPWLWIGLTVLGIIMLVVISFLALGAAVVVQVAHTATP